MFAFDTTFPINILFLVFLLLCLSACIVGMRETTESDDTEEDLPAVFRDLAQLTDSRPRTNGQTAQGARQERERRP